MKNILVDPKRMCQLYLETKQWGHSERINFWDYIYLAFNLMVVHGPAVKEGADLK